MVHAEYLNFLIHLQSLLLALTLEPDLAIRMDLQILGSLHLLLHLLLSLNGSGHPEILLLPLAQQ